MNALNWFFLILTILAWGTTPILEKAALKGTNPLAGLFIRNAVAFFVFLLFFVFTGRLKNIYCNLSFKSTLLFSMSGILAGFLGMYCYYRVLKINPSSKIVPLAATYPLVAVLLGMVFLKEEVTAARIIGTVLIILGVLLVK